jgi:xanthine dehydrogenase YagR molybdenum-binding subunit
MSTKSNKVIGEPMNRVDGKLKVTGAATYSAEYKLANTAYAVLVSSTIAKGTIKNIDTKAAENAPGVIAVISHVNSIKVPGYKEQHGEPGQPQPVGRPLKVFYDNKVYFNGQPIAVVVAGTFERARYAASLVKVQYDKQAPQTGFQENMDKAIVPEQAKKNPKAPTADYTRGAPDGYSSAPVKIEAEYFQPTEFHNPMELQSIIAYWETEDRLTLYDKVQGTQPTQQNFAKEWQIPVENIRVISTFVGGAFGNALRNWPHETAAIIAAKMVKRPVKLMLTREQMFFMVGYRPRTWQKVNMGATQDGKLVGITHSVVGQTSSYEQFTEGTLAQTRTLYDCPNVNTRYRLLPLDVSTPAPMRGPGEATGAWALECAMDEMAHALNMDPIEFRLRNYPEKDPDNGKPWSSNNVRDCYKMGAEAIGWTSRKQQPGTLRDGDWLIGYGMATGMFGANRQSAKVRGKLYADGTLQMQCAVTDIGPGTGTAMTQIAADNMGVPVEKIIFQWGNSDFPEMGNQGGSSTVNSVGPAVVAACNSIKQKLVEMAGKKKPEFANAKIEDLVFDDGKLSTKDNSSSVSYQDILKDAGEKNIDVIEGAKPGEERNQYAMYAFSMHFAEVHVHAVTGQIKIKKVVACADAGTIINKKTAGNQMIGGVSGGIGMALEEEAVIDNRFGRYITKDLADYHVAVHADVPKIEVLFVDKPDLLVDPIGSKGLGEIAIIGVAPAIANAIFNATGKRVRDLPITPDKLI